MNRQRTFDREDLPAALQLALDLAVAKNARAPVILRVTDVAGYTDWVMLVSGRSDRHVKGIADAIVAGLRDAGTRPLGTDGLDRHEWDLLDYDDFIVHVFYHPLRVHFDLESMWSDAPRVQLDLDAEIMDTTDLDGLEAPSQLPEYRGDLVFGGYADEFDDDDDDEARDSMSRSREPADDDRQV